MQEVWVLDKQMKTEQEIKDRLETFSEEKMKAFPYDKNGQPFGQWAYQQDLGWKAALEWVLGIKKT